MNSRSTRHGHVAALGQGAIRGALVLLVAMLISPAYGDGAEPSLDEILTRVRDTTGFARLVKHENGILLTGKTERYGTDGSSSLLFHPDGRFVEKTKARLGSTVGYDGKVAWAVDWSGLPTLLELEDLEIVLGQQWIASGRWLAEDGPFVITVNEKETNGEEVTLDMLLRDGVLVWKLVLDRESWLPARLSLDSKGGTDTWTLSDYRKFKGMRFACHVRHVGNTGKTDITEITDIAAAPHFVRDPYERIVKGPQDTHFKPDVPAELKVKVTPTGHLLVHPRVGGRDVGWFIFDTGAGAMVISPKVADAAKMPAFGKVTANGVGGMVETQFRQGKSFTLGRATMDNPIYVELDLSFLTPHFGVEVAGICGYDLLARVVAEFDPYKRKISLFDPASYKLEKGDWRQLFVGGRHPHVMAKFEGEHEGVFRLDTGAADTVSFHAPAVRRLGLLDGRDTAVSMRGGAGGMQSVRSGTIEWFELAGHRFEQPVVAFGLSDLGAMAGHRAMGTIGLKFLEPFVVVFNYHANKIAFVERG